MKKLILHIALLIFFQSLYAQHDHHAKNGKNEMTDKNIFLSMMDTMMVQMDAVAVGNSPAAIFLQQMIPHHQGAISMAEYEIKNGKNAEMIQLAKSILVEQKSEIQQMQLWLNKIGNDKITISLNYLQKMNQTMMTMMETMPTNDKLNNIDIAFAAVMIPHHQAALDMAKVLLNNNNTEPVNSYAKLLISNQQIEINQMLIFLKKQNEQ